MNQEFRKEWVDALLSGKYKQGKGLLESNNKFCCLGVAEDLLVKKGILKKEHDRGVGLVKYTDLEGDGNAALLCDRAIEFMQVISQSPKVSTIGYQDVPQHLRFKQIDLSTLNDNDVPFKVIAKLIDEQL